MSTAILLVRHGETAWNRERIFRGVHDIPLNENGRTQAGHLAKALASRSIDAAYTSPLSRAAETARIVLAPHSVEPTIHAGFQDFNYGEWTGEQEQVVARRWPKEYARWIAAPHTIRPAGGDMLKEVHTRAFGFLDVIAQKHDGQTVAIFAHRVVNKLLILGMLTLGLERFPFIRQDNCCVNEFERTAQGYIVKSLNDTGHIRHAGTDLLRVDF